MFFLKTLDVIFAYTVPKSLISFINDSAYWTNLSMVQINQTLNNVQQIHRVWITENNKETCYAYITTSYAQKSVKKRHCHESAYIPLIGVKPILYTIKGSITTT